MFSNSRRGSVIFRAAHERRPAGGSREPPHICICNGNVDREAEAALADNNRPCGVLLKADETVGEVERCKNTSHCHGPGTICFLNFADDTYIFARHMRMLEFQISVLQRVLARTGQQLNVSKYEALVPDTSDEGPRPRTWTDRELDWHIRTGQYPQGVPNARDGELERLSVGASMLVMGSFISYDRPQRLALPARLQAAWLRWSQIRGQVGCRHSTLKSKIRLIDAVILPALLWGLETVPLSQPDRRRLDGVQRRMVGRALLVGRRPQELLPDFFRRRERCISGAIRRHARGIWSELSRFRTFTFAGHVARLAPADHMAAQTLACSSDQWWEKYKEALPPKTGGQIGRRAANKGIPGMQAAPFRDNFDLLRSTARGRDILKQAAAELGDWPGNWQRLAQARNAWRSFAREVCVSAQ